MREKIKSHATSLLIKNGIRGLRFGDIASQLDITRANIHYHFGTKDALVAEVVEDYIEQVLEEMRRIWTAPDTSIQEKARQTMEFNRSRYRKYNSGGKDGRPWSLISRMRLESDQLSPRPKRALADFSVQLRSYVHDEAVLAQQRGEIGKTAPIDDIVVLLAAIVDSAGSITQDTGSFDNVEHMYLAWTRIVANAYGKSPQ